MKHWVATSLLSVFYLTCSFAQLTTVIQKGHEEAVKEVVFSPDGKLLATGSRDKTIKIWDVQTGHEIKTLFGHNGTITDLIFSADGDFIYSAGADNLVKIYDISTGKEIYSYKDTDLITSIALSPDGDLFIGGYHEDVKLISTKTPSSIKLSLKANPEKGLGYGLHVNISNNGKFLAVGEDDRTLKVYSSSSGLLLHTLKPPYGWCGGCATYSAFNANDQHIARLSNNDTLRIYSLDNGQEIKTLGPLMEDINGIYYNPVNEDVIYAGTDNALYQYNLKTEEVHKLILAGEEELINDFNISPDGRFIATAHNDNVVRLWNTQDGSFIKTFSGILNLPPADGLGYDPNQYWESHIARYLRYKNDWIISAESKEIIKGKIGSFARKWKYSSGEILQEYIGHEKAVTALAEAHNGEYFITGGGDGKIIIWSSNGDSLKSIQAHRQPIFDLAISNNSRWIASASWDGTAQIWDVETGGRIQYFDLENNSPYTLSFSPNDLYLLIGRLGNELTLYEIDTKKPVREFIGHTGIISSITFGDQGQVLSSSWDGTVRLWDIASGLMTAKFSSPSSRLQSAIFTSNGKVLTAGADRNIYLWDPATNETEKIFEGHQSEITNLYLAESENLLISGSVDGTTLFWNYDNGSLFFEHITVGDKDWMVKTAEGYFSATSGAQQVVHFVEGLKSYQPEQFFSDFYRPDLINEAFKIRGTKKMQGQGLREKILSFPPPKVNINALVSTKPGYADLYLRIINEGGGVNKINLFHNGKSINVDHIQPIIKTDTFIYQLEIPLVSGQNEFAVSAISKGNIESLPGQVSLFSDVTATPPKCYILSIGINEYKNPQLNLNYAYSDANHFINLSKEGGKTIFSEVKTIELYDDLATKQSILKNLDELAAVIQPEDVFIFYFAGHGSINENEFYFIPHESTRLYDPKTVIRQAISADEMNAKLKQIKALKQVIFMDACQSGGSVDVLAQRGSVEEKALAQLSRSAGIHILAAAGSEQFATEYKELEHGLFTYLLLKALEGEADGAPKDGKITVYELKSYIDDKMPDYNRRYKGKSQYPYTFSRGSDFPIVLVK